MCCCPLWLKVSSLFCPFRGEVSSSDVTNTSLQQRRNHRRSATETATCRSSRREMNRGPDVANSSGLPSLHGRTPNLGGKSSAIWITTRQQSAESCRHPVCSAASTWDRSEWLTDAYVFSVAARWCLDPKILSDFPVLCETSPRKAPQIAEHVIMFIRISGCNWTSVRLLVLLKVG